MRKKKILGFYVSCALCIAVVYGVCIVLIFTITTYDVQTAYNAGVACGKLLLAYVLTCVGATVRS